MKNRDFHVHSHTTLVFVLLKRLNNKNEYGTGSLKSKVHMKICNITQYWPTTWQYDYKTNKVKYVLTCQ